MDDAHVIPVVEEELVKERTPVKTGSVRIQKHVEERIERIEDELLRDATEVQHIPVNRPVSEMPKLRQEGDLIIVPVVEEEIVVTKRLILKEELHIRRKQTIERVTKEVPVLKERAVVERLDSGGRVIDETPQPLPPAVEQGPVSGRREPRSILNPEPRPKRRRSLLE